MMWKSTKESSRSKGKCPRSNRSGGIVPVRLLRGRIGEQLVGKHPQKGTGTIVQYVVRLCLTQMVPVLEVLNASAEQHKHQYRRGKSKTLGPCPGQQLGQQYSCGKE